MILQIPYKIPTKQDSPFENVSIPINRVLETKYNTLCSRQESFSFYNGYGPIFFPRQTEICRALSVERLPIVNLSKNTELYIV